MRRLEGAVWVPHNMSSNSDFKLSDNVISSCCNIYIQFECFCIVNRTQQFSSLNEDVRLYLCDNQFKRVSRSQIDRRPANGCFDFQPSNRTTGKCSIVEVYCRNLIAKYIPYLRYFYGGTYEVAAPDDTRPSHLFVCLLLVGSTGKMKGQNATKNGDRPD